MEPYRRDESADLPFLALWPYLLIAFGLAWGIFALFIGFADWMTARFGQISGSHPLFILAVYSPAIAAIALVAVWGGIDGLKRYLSRLLLWRSSPGWHVMLLIGIPLIYAAGSLIKGNLIPLVLPFSDFGTMLSAMAFMLVLGPVEEFGWRGVALPLLQRRLAPLWASLVLGAIWGMWHLPAFFLSGTPQSAWGFTPFLVGSIAISVIVTAMFNASGGSILLAALFHFQLNNPLWPDAQPYDSLIFAVAAMLVFWCNRDLMLQTDEAAKRVIPKRETIGP